MFDLNVNMQTGAVSKFYIMTFFLTKVNLQPTKKSLVADDSNFLRLTDSASFAVAKFFYAWKLVTISLEFKFSTVVFGGFTEIQSAHVKKGRLDFQIIFSSLDNTKGWGIIDLKWFSKMFEM